eukprot:scaffold99544_cov36-Prasinocladus_malaysianus.AAC.2
MVYSAVLPSPVTTVVTTLASTYARPSSWRLASTVRPLCMLGPRLMPPSFDRPRVYTGPYVSSGTEHVAVPAVQTP